VLVQVACVAVTLFIALPVYRLRLYDPADGRR
jgi:hypothetical protein